MHEPKQAKPKKPRWGVHGVKSDAMWQRLLEHKAVLRTVGTEDALTIALPDFVCADFGCEATHQGAGLCRAALLVLQQCRHDYLLVNWPAPRRCEVTNGANTELGRPSARPREVCLRLA